MQRWGLIFVLVLISRAAWGDEPYYPVTPQSSPASDGPGFGLPNPGPSQPPSPYDSAWPPHTARESYTGPVSPPPTPGMVPPPPGLTPSPPGVTPLPRTMTAPPPGGKALSPQPYDGPATAAQSADRVGSATISYEWPRGERPIESTWYYRLESFHWNERVDGTDFVNEYGPISTLGYQRRNGAERVRVELFGGTVAYDGAAQMDDGSLDPYHQSNGTNYLGCRGEYDLLFDPWSSSCVRFFVGLGTRFWIRDLRDAMTPDGVEVMGYQETWWTLYPYVGIETKEPTEPGLHFFCSARIGATPLTYQHASYFETTVYPRCGLTGNLEVGARYSGFLLSAYMEAMTWAQSAMVRDSFQPDSNTFTFGGRLAYSF
jgi:hypothetical protein